MKRDRPAGDVEFVHPSDADLLRSAGRGDDGAFHTLVDRHAAALYQVALSFTRRNRADAEDLVQETLVAAFRGANGFAGRSSVRTWMLQILSREAARAWRRSKWRRQTLSLDAPASSPAVASSQPVTNPAAGVAGVDHRLDIMDVLRELSDIHREVLVMREIWSLSYDEIAQALGVPRGTVESRLSRARAAFRQRFGEREG